MERLKSILLDQKQIFENKRDLMDRDIDLRPYLKTKQIVVVSGVRRCGKSSLLFLIKNRLGLLPEDYCYFNFEDERIIPDTELFDKIYRLHVEIYGKDPIFFFDEIQLVPGWEKFANRMYESNHKLYVTGSNGKLLSSEISTSLTGRCKTIRLFPFSFAEYLRYCNISFDLNTLTPRQDSLLQRAFNEYVRYGGFPLVIEEQDLQIIQFWFQDILYRDVIARYKVSQVRELKQLAIFLLSNIGKIFSYATLCKICGIKSPSTVKNYVEYFEQSYMLSFVNKFDFSVKKQMLNPSKVYAIDPAVAYQMGFKFSENSGRLMENIVYIELLRRGKNIFYSTGAGECDFVLQEGIHVTEAIQVVDDLTLRNIERELSGLTEAMRTFDIPRGLILAGHCEEQIALPENVEIQKISHWLLT